VSNLVEIEAMWSFRPAENVAPADPAAVAVPTEWLGFGQAPFGTLGSAIVKHPINTVWPVDTGLWIKRDVVVSGLAPLLLSGRVEQAALVYFDGVYIGGVNPANESRTTLPAWYLVVPKSMATEGTHELAILCLDEETTNPGDTSYIYCQAEYLPAFMPLPPRAPVRETLNWKTDVMESFDGSEQRMALRTDARQQLAYYYPANFKEAARALNIVYGAHAERWLVPLWSEAQLIGAVAAGLSSLAATLDPYDFRESSLVLLWETPDHWQILGVDLIDGALTLVGLTEEFRNAWLMPVRFGRNTGTVPKSTTGYDSEFTLTFDVLDLASVETEAPEQFLGEDIYYDPTLMGASVKDNLIRRVEVHDEALGVVSWRSPWNHTRVSRPHRVIRVTPEEVRDFRKWLQRREGRYKAFWQPTFECDLRPLSSGVIASNLIVSSDEYKHHASDRLHIAVEVKGGTWYPRTILNALLLDEERTQLNLDAPLNVPASSILRVSYLGLKRLDTDRVEIRWNGGGVAQSEVRVVELTP